MNGTNTITVTPTMIDQQRWKLARHFRKHRLLCFLLTASQP